MPVAFDFDWLDNGRTFFCKRGGFTLQLRVPLNDMVENVAIEKYQHKTEP